MRAFHAAHLSLKLMNKSSQPQEKEPLSVSVAVLLYSS